MENWCGYIKTISIYIYLQSAVSFECYLIKKANHSAGNEDQQCNICSYFNFHLNLASSVVFQFNLSQVNPIQTRGRGSGFYLHGLWTFITFLISKLKPPNLVTFPKIYLETIWCSESLSIGIDITMATTF